MLKKRVKDIGYFERKIRSALKEQNTYSKSMEFSIRYAAGACLCFERVLCEIAELDKPYIDTLSREKNKRLLRHPIMAEFSEQAENVRKALRELRITPGTVNLTDNDEVDNLINDVNNIKDDNR